MWATNRGAGARALALSFYQNVGIAEPSLLPSCPPALHSYSKTALVLDFYRERPRNVGLELLPE